MVKDFPAGTPNGFCRDKCVLHVLLPEHLVIAGILYSNYLFAPYLQRTL